MADSTWPVGVSEESQNVKTDHEHSNDFLFRIERRWLS